MLDKIRKFKFFKSKTENKFTDQAIQNNANVINQNFVDPRILMNELLSNGKLGLAVDVFKDVTQAIEKSHPLAPRYYYDINRLGDKVFFISKPINETIAIEMPLSYKGNFVISDDEFKPEIGIQKYLFQQSLRNTPIKIHIKSLEELIGDVKIDNPMSILNAFGERIDAQIIPYNDRPIIKAKMIIKQDDEERDVIDYLEMQLTDYDAVDEILTISNLNQKISYLNISLQIPVKNISMNNEMLEIIGMNYNVALREGHCLTVEGELFFLEFLEVAQDSHMIQIWDIERNKLVCEGSVKNSEDEGLNINEYDSQIKTLRMLKSMEDMYKVKFILPEIIDAEEEQFLHLLLLAWESKEVEFNFDGFEALVNDKKSLLNIVQTVEDDEKSLFSIESIKTISGKLFGVNIECISEENFDMLLVEDISLIKSKLKLFQEGETMKISFAPQNGAKAYKNLKIVSMS